MHRMRLERWAVGVMIAFTLSASAAAQWNANPATNLAIGDRPGEQNQPKIRPTSDGGCYISWFDNSTGGYDVYLQRLNAQGVEQWPHNGVLIADLALGSTTDYGLAVDDVDRAILAFQDTRFGGTRITASLVHWDGTLLWGTNGVQVSNGNGSSPHVAALDDGTYVVAWTEGSNVRRQKLGQGGATMWANGGMDQNTPGGSTDLICDVVASEGNAACIISWVRNPSRILQTMKYNGMGSPMWNAGAPVDVFNGSALQFGYFPTFLPDGQGGAVFGYYETGGPRNCYVQRIQPNGMEMFAHNGVAASTSANIKLTPGLAYNPSTQDIFLFWTETNAGQNMWGLYGQKFVNGVRQWTDTGKEIIPLNANQNAFVKAIYNNGGGASVFCFDRSGPALVVGSRLDSAGNFVWPSNVIQACSTLSGKARLDVARSSCDGALLVWADARNDANDIFAQHVRPGAEFGPTFPGDVDADGNVNINDLLQVISSWGPCPLQGPCAGDLFPYFNCDAGDGLVNVNDLLIVISNWG